MATDEATGTPDPAFLDTRMPQPRSPVGIANAALLGDQEEYCAKSRLIHGYIADQWRMASEFDVEWSAIMISDKEGCVQVAPWKGDRPTKAFKTFGQSPVCFEWVIGTQPFRSSGGPTVVFPDYCAWKDRNGRTSNVNGPAVLNHSIAEYYVNGVKYESGRDPAYIEACEAVLREV